LRRIPPLVVEGPVRSATGGGRAAAASRRVRHRRRFIADPFRHRHVEETVHSALPGQQFDDAELRALLEPVPASSRLTPTRFDFDALPA
jgi:hypothetical protein